MPLARSRTRLGLTSRKSLIRLARELLWTSSAVMLTIAARDAKRPVVSPFSPLRFLAETARWNRSRSSRTCVVWAGLPLLSSSRSPPNGPGSPRNLRRSWPVATVALAQPLDRQVSSGGRVGHRRSLSFYEGRAQCRLTRGVRWPDRRSGAMSLASDWMRLMTAHDVARLLPDIPMLRDLCRSMAVLEAILSPEWSSRYHSFDADWSPGEEMASMRERLGRRILHRLLRGGCVHSRLRPRVSDEPVQRRRAVAGRA